MSLLLAIDRHRDPDPDPDPNQDRNDEGPRLLRWIIPGSVALHVVAIVLMPRAAAPHAPTPISSVVIEMQAPPPPPPPLPLPPTAPTPAPITTVAKIAPSAPAPVATAVIKNEAPLDFTSTVFSSEGPGIGIGSPSPSPAPSSPPPPPSHSAPTVAVAPPPPAFVPAASLGRSPRAPGSLDASALERNYPADARRAGISGSAVLRVRLDSSGHVIRVDVASESYAGFGAACERTVRSGGNWDPPLDRDGRAVSTEIKYVCKFEVRS